MQEVKSAVDYLMAELRKLNEEREDQIQIKMKASNKIRAIEMQQQVLAEALCFLEKTCKK